MEGKREARDFVNVIVTTLYIVCRKLNSTVVGFRAYTST